MALKMPKLRKFLMYSTPFFSLYDKNDVVTKDTKTALNADLSLMNDETGLDRLKAMLTPNEFGDLSPELNSIFQVGCLSIFCGSIYGGVMSTKTTYIDFMQNNQATMFRDHLEAKKKLQDKMTLSFAKGAFRWAWRLTFFSMTYMSISTTISVYRNKNGIAEHLAAGAVSGCLYKFTGGPRAMLVGSALGLVLGAFAGGITMALLSLSGMSMEDVRYWNYKWKESRNKSYREYVGKHYGEMEMLKFHEKNLKDEKDSIFKNEQS